MIIKEILIQLESSVNPVARALHKGDHFKVLAIGFRQGMILKEHRSPLPAKLTVLYGSVIYREAEKTVSLTQYDETDIPVNIIHSVEAVTDSLCLLTQG